MLRNYLAERRMRQFLTMMPRALAHDYGRAGEYTSGQVTTAAKKLGYDNAELIEIAVAIYCRKEYAQAFGINEALIKKYRGYPEQHRVTVECAIGGGGFDVGGGLD